MPSEAIPSAAVGGDGTLQPYIRLPEVPVIKGRQDIILSHCRGARVLHLGCVDTGLLEERFRQGILMHQRLARIAGELCGVDINAEGVAFLAERGFDDVLVGDVSDATLYTRLEGRTFDVILASEVVEHLLNPGLFLEGVQRLMVPGETELIVTVPNAFRLRTLLWMLRGVEYVHPDHNYWFSYLTATNLLLKTGFQIERVVMYSNRSFHVVPRRLRTMLESTGAAVAAPATASEGTRSERVPPLARLASAVAGTPYRLLAATMYRLNPFWADGLILFARLPRGGQPGSS